MMKPDEITKLNKLATGFGSASRKDMAQAASGRLKKVRYKAGKDSGGVVDKVSFIFPRFGVFREMGVFGGLTREEAIAQNKLDPRPWFNPSLERHLPELEKGLAEAYSGFVINALNLKIKNV